MRYPRGKGPGTPLSGSLETVEIGKGVLKRKGRSVAILAFGSMVEPALAAAEKIDASVADMRFVKPLDHELIGDLATTHQLIVTIEENTVNGGAGSAVNEHLLSANYSIPILNLGLPDEFLEHGKVPEMLAAVSLGSDSIVKSIEAKLKACKIQSEAV